jgi:pimeloyl-ACP methyl ester carboxylesterase
VAIPLGGPGGLGIVTLSAWISSGIHIPVETREGAAKLFVWRGGRGPTVTLLHGYPGSSYDWEQVAEHLTAGFDVIAPDHLGFGASDKPFPYPYSIREQADLLEQVWSALGVSETFVVAHDYSTSVAQELLRRGSSVQRSVVFLNGAVYPALHRPTEGQLALLAPDGDKLALLIDERMWSDALAATFGPRHPATPQQLAQLWSSFSSHDGQRLSATLLHYVADRAVDGDAWASAMETTTTPIAFVWGPSDPVSGEHVISEVERRMPATPITRLAGVGHWPMLEDPDGVSTAVTGLLRPTVDPSF